MYARFAGLRKRVVGCRLPPTPGSSSRGSAAGRGAPRIDRRRAISPLASPQPGQEPTFAAEPEAQPSRSYRPPHVAQGGLRRLRTIRERGLKSTIAGYARGRVCEGDESPQSRLRRRQIAACIEPPALNPRRKVLGCHAMKYATKPTAARSLAVVSLWPVFWTTPLSPPHAGCSEDSTGAAGNRTRVRSRSDG